MNKKLMLLAAFALALAAFTGPGYSAAEGKKGMKGHAGHGSHGKHGGQQGAKVTLKGEIIDLSCYMAHEGKGKKHRKCARSCVIDKGLPMGLLTDEGKVFFLVEDHSKAKAFKKAKQATGDRVEIRGKKYVRGGSTAVSVGSIKKL
jgi:hypothetical protein